MATPESTKTALVTIQTNQSQGAKPIATNISAAIIQDNARSLAKTIELAKQLNLQAYMYCMRNDGEIDWAAAQLMKDFATGINARVDVIYDITQQNYTNDIDKVVDFFSLKSTKGTIVWGWESVDQFDGNQYTDIFNQCAARVAGTGIVNCADAGLIYRNSGKSADRTAACGKLTTAQSERQYTQLAPDRMRFTSIMQSNLTLLKTYFDTTLLNDWFGASPIYSCASQMPNLKISDIQWHWEDSVPGQSYFITGKPLGNWAAGQMTKIALKNTDRVNYLCWMSNSNLYNNTVANLHWNDLKRIAPLFRFKNSLPVTTTLSGVDGWCVADGNGNYALMLTNETATEYNLAINDIQVVGGGKVQGTVKRDSGSAETWDVPTLNEVIMGESGFKIKKHSTSVFYFFAQKTANS